MNPLEEVMMMLVVARDEVQVIWGCNPSSHSNPY